MGYYTQYKLEDVDPPERYQEVKDALSRRAYPTPNGTGKDCGGLAISPWIDDDRWGNSSPGCKWYTCWQDADAVAASLPDVAFTIAEFGEDFDGDPTDPSAWLRTRWARGNRREDET